MKYSKRISSLFVMVFLLVSLSAAAAEDYWQRLQNKADSLYSGFDGTVVLNTGLEHREYFDRTHTGPYGNLELQVPLYSKKERIEKSKAKVEFLQKGAEQIKIVEERGERVEILKKKAQVLKSVMMDEGAAGIKAYYDCCEDMAKLEAETREAKKKLDAMLKD